MRNMEKNDILKIGLIAFILIFISILHYFLRGFEHMYVIFLFYVPLVLGGMWYGLKGALAISAAMILLYAPHLTTHINWNNFSQKDFDEVMEVVVFISIAVLLGTLVDRERRHRKSIMEAERLATIGRTVSEIAHDMKTPLMSIGGFVIQVARKLSDDDPNKKKLDIVVQETSRLEEMVKSMLEFGRPVSLEISETNINDLLEDIIRLLQNTAKEAGIKLEAHCNPHIPLIKADRRKIHRVLLNVITNAIQASPNGGTVTVETLGEGNNVVIKVKDNGPGIKEDQKENVFHPFFTTKKHGTGLGLGIAKKVVDAHEGEIFFVSNRGEPGVTFVIKLPISR